VTATLMQDAYEKLRARIVSGQLAPGARLINRALAGQLGVSTVTVREALHRLTSEGLVEHVPNAGAFVTQFDRKDVVALYRFREALECFAVAEAVQRIDDDQLRRLDDICTQWRQMARRIRSMPDQQGDPEFHQRWLQLDIQYHEILVEAADNRWLSKTLRDMRVLARIVRAKPKWLSLAMAARTVRQHAALARALRKGQAELAQRWMIIQMREGLQSSLAALDAGVAGGAGDDNLLDDETTW